MIAIDTPPVTVVSRMLAESAFNGLGLKIDERRRRLVTSGSERSSQ
jgi:hypothetical protein